MAIFIFEIADPPLFTNLLLFSAYYAFLIEFYEQDRERQISVKELLFLKYIDMVKDVLTNFNEQTASQEQKKELLTTLQTLNAKLYTTIKNIKEQGETDLRIDLKTMQDLIKTDF